MALRWRAWRHAACWAEALPSGQASAPRLATRSVSAGYQYGASDADVEDIIESNLAKTRVRKEDADPVRVLTTKREALSLYRDIIRVTRAFVYPDSNGRLWRDVLRESARQEFEAARFEQDPEIINRLIVVGRDAVSQVTDKFVEMAKKPPPTAPGGGGQYPGR